MEKFSQFRDRGESSPQPCPDSALAANVPSCSGSGIAPFLPVPRQSSGAYLPVLIFLFVIRLPIFITVVLGYFLVLQWLPLGSLARKALLWLILGVPGVWWIDLQIDGVKRGYVRLLMESPCEADPY